MAAEDTEVPPWQPLPAKSCNVVLAEVVSQAEGLGSNPPSAPLWSCDVEREAHPLNSVSSLEVCDA
jgi:hypothetical protein